MAVLGGSLPTMTSCGLDGKGAVSGLSVGVWCSVPSLVIMVLVSICLLFKACSRAVHVTNGARSFLNATSSNDPNF